MARCAYSIEVTPLDTVSRRKNGSPFRNRFDIRSVEHLECIGTYAIETFVFGEGFCVPPSLHLSANINCRCFSNSIISVNIFDKFVLSNDISRHLDRHCVSMNLYRLLPYNGAE